MQCPACSRMHLCDCQQRLVIMCNDYAYLIHLQHMVLAIMID